jgi:hypothetical protein
VVSWIEGGEMCHPAAALMSLGINFDRKVADCRLPGGVPGGHLCSSGKECFPENYSTADNLSWVFFEGGYVLQRNTDAEQILREEHY